MRFEASLLAALLFCVATTSVASAQVQSGSINGVVRDEQGGVLPGVTVTLQGNGPTQTVVTEAEGQYRFLNVPPGTYAVTATLTGFQTVAREGVVVAVGQNVALTITLGVATVQETITVTGESPVIDAKAMGTATNFTQDELARVPNSRDPWALLRTVPGVTLDRVNIAGNETGQQAVFVSKGGTSGRRGVDDGRRADHRYGHGRRLADLLRLRRLRRNPDLDGRQRHPAGHRRRRPQLRRQARDEPVPRHGARLLHG